MSAQGPMDATCPSCGAPLRFSVGQSRAAVCSYCHALVARKGQDFSAVGKVADLIPTGSRLQLGLTGKLGAHGLRLVGRVQYEWEQGAWDEWYVAVDDGRWGWLAEAQGRYFLTFPDQPPDVPPFQALVPGVSFIHPQHGTFVLTDRKRARVGGLEGELPDQIALEDDARTADFQGPRSLVATVDYSDEAPRFFVGREILLEQLHLSPVAEAPPARRAKAAAELKCPNCHAPVQVRVPDQSVRAVCESCGAILETSKGALEVLSILSKLRSVPPIPIGTRGTLRGRTFLVVGWMRRGCEVEGDHYDWQELLLYEPKTTGFVWLVLSDGHWQLAEPISAGEVKEWPTGVRYQDRTYRFFSHVTGEVEEVLGEFYWAVKLHDWAELYDYTGPPNGISSEQTDDELNFSFLTHLDTAEVAEAFARPGLKSEPVSGVGTIQPYPYGNATRAIFRWCGFAALAVLALGILLGARGKTLVYQHEFGPGELAPRPSSLSPSTAPTNPSAQRPPGAGPTAPSSHAFLSPRFRLSSGRAVEVELTTTVDNHWAYADGALVPAEGGPSQVFGLETSYYHGSDSGGSWSEGSRDASANLSAPPAGDYVIRADLQWDPKLRFPPAMTLRVYSGGASGGQLVFALLALLGPLAIIGAHRASFEKSRWQNSTVGSGG